MSVWSSCSGGYTRERGWGFEFHQPRSARKMPQLATSMERMGSSPVSSPDLFFSTFKINFLKNCLPNAFLCCVSEKQLMAKGLFAGYCMLWVVCCVLHTANLLPYIISLLPCAKPKESTPAVIGTQWLPTYKVLGLALTLPYHVDFLVAHIFKVLTSLHNNVTHVVVAPNMARCTSYMEP